jgi:hypothetical protein
VRRLLPAIVAVAALALATVVWTTAQDAAEEPEEGTTFVNEFGTPCAEIPGTPAASPDASPEDAMGTAPEGSPAASPAASPMPIMIPGCLTAEATPGAG